MSSERTSLVLPSPNRAVHTEMNTIRNVSDHIISSSSNCTDENSNTRHYPPRVHTNRHRTGGKRVFGVTRYRVITDVVTQLRVADNENAPTSFASPAATRHARWNGPCSGAAAIPRWRVFRRIVNRTREYVWSSVCRRRRDCRPGRLSRYPGSARIE